ncbi:MAG: hypothetical protein JOZ32_07700 [Bryobacterales bacterium]|nr:hypothetical protein [Bryobacterales bacterium]
MRMAELSFTAVSGAGVSVARDPSVNALAGESGPNIGAAISEISAVLGSCGLRIDSRAKYASGKTFHWVRVMESSGREIASSGGWFGSEDTAVQHALDMLQLIEAFRTC